jgi:hypothetical protein
MHIIIDIFQNWKGNGRYHDKTRQINFQVFLNGHLSDDPQLPKPDTIAPIVA